jgi:4'-phosphopantetheinyl transferase
VARALVRTTLSRYSATAPEAWRFVLGEHGCPFIDPDQNTEGLRFNLSHTTGLIVLAVTRGRDVGVDVEFEPRDSRTTKIADRFFAPSEVAALHRLPEAEQRERFFAYWTLKESYIKARGMGLAIPLKRFWFDVDTPGEICLDGAPELDDDPKTWAFARLRMSPQHPVAVALRCPPEHPFALRVFETVPLGGDQEVSPRLLARSVR